MSIKILLSTVSRGSLKPNGIIAIGNNPNPLISQTMPELEITKWGTIIVDEETMATSVPGVYAGGDIVSGAATVILAMGQGRIAAASINEYLAKK